MIPISIFLENDVASDPDGYGPDITYFNHQDTFWQMQQLFAGLKREDSPDGEAWAIEKVALTTHNGTHLDAPYHFHSTMNKGENRLPLMKCRWIGVMWRPDPNPFGFIIMLSGRD